VLRSRYKFENLFGFFTAVLKPFEIGGATSFFGRSFRVAGNCGVACWGWDVNRLSSEVKMGSAKTATVFAAGARPLS
jgi:hypothetical protein